MSRKPATREDLVSAYVDGVAELPLEERRAVEALLGEDAAARAEAEAVRGLLGRLRDLPPSPSTEPDWGALERSIRDAVGAEAPRRWWRGWRWVLPGSTLLAGAAALLLTLGRPTPVEAPAGRVGTAVPAPRAPTAPVAAAPGGDVVHLWLDGDQVDLDPELGVLLVGAENQGDDQALLPSSDLAWVDSLDDEALGRAEQWVQAQGRKRG